MFINKKYYSLLWLLQFVATYSLKTKSDYEEEKEEETTFSRFNLRSSNFAEIATTGSFVDKTRYIQTFVEESGIIVLTAPHHFGKSTNINMVKRFLEIEVDDKGTKKTKTASIREPVRDTENYKLFVENKLKITENTTFMDYHFGKHPVIFVDFKFDNVHVVSYDIAVEQFKYIIHRTYVEHHYLKQSERLNTEERNIVKKWCSTSDYSKMTECDVSDSLRLLSRFLYRHWENRRVYVLIDNFDSPVMNAIFFALTEDIMGGVYRVMSSIIIKVLQKNFHAHRGMISGVSYIAGSPSLYSLDYVKVCRFLENHTFAGFHGLTKHEAVRLLSMNNFNLKLSVMTTLEQFYGGYQSCSNNTVFNFWSVIHFLLTNETRSYWKNPGLIFNLEKLLKVPAVNREITYLSKGKERQVRLKKIYAPDDVIRLRDLLRRPEHHKELHNTDIIMSFLLELGYLTFVPSEQLYQGKKILKIPNEEMGLEIRATIQKYDDHYSNYNVHKR